MNFYLANPELDKKVQEIRRKIRLNMNGVTTELMEKNGILYKQNYGVAIPSIRIIARQYEPDHDLAQRLWSLKIRETMILASLLEEPDLFTQEQACLWMEDVNQVELVEQLCMNLFCKLPYALQFSMELIRSSELWYKITGFTLVLRIAPRIGKEEAELIVREAVEQSAVESVGLSTAIAAALCRLGQNGGEMRNLILSTLAVIRNTGNKGQEYVVNQVEEEFAFLEDL